MKPKSPDKSTPVFIHRLARGIAWLISKPLWFIRFHGRENIPHKNVPGFLIAANHQTYIDPVWISIPTAAFRLARKTFAAVGCKLGKPIENRGAILGQ